MGLCSVVKDHSDQKAVGVRLGEVRGRAEQGRGWQGGIDKVQGRLIGEQRLV